MDEARESSEGEWMTVRDFLDTCSNNFKYSFGGFGSSSRRGQFHTRLDEMKEEPEWQQSYRRDIAEKEIGKPVRYTFAMLNEAKRRTLEKTSDPGAY